MIPTRKVGFGMIAGALAVIIVWILGMNGIVMPEEVVSAATVILSLGTSYLVPEDIPGDHEA